jgi:eukaryotic-like serine/threonine-protein kinase
MTQVPDAPAAGVLLAERFELQATLGRGGMATVYRAWDRDGARPCAVKVLSELLSGDEQFRRRFRQEAAAAQGLTHPNIVRVDDWGEAGSHPYIVMEYVAGGTLRDLMRRCGPLPQPVALRIAVEVADALAHAHARGVVHRDIKPENLLLAENGQIKVADFGIARTVDAAALTRTGIVMGSARYLSPEQARGHAAGPRADLYALGVVLFEMLAGRVPFDGDSAVAIAVQHVHERPPRLQQLRSDVAEPVAACVERLLAKGEDDRYPSAAALGEDLRRCGAPLPGALEDGTPPTPVRGRGATMETAHLDLQSQGPLAISQTATLATDGIAGTAGTTAALPPANAARIEPALPTDVPRHSVARTPPWSGTPGTRRRTGDFRSAAVIVLLIVLATILGTYAYRPGRPRVVVPSLVGQSVTAASSSVRALGLHLVVAARRQDARTPAGLIVAQDPPPGGLQGNALEVRVVVSQGSGVVPDLHGLSFADATRLVHAAGLRLQRIADIGGNGNDEDRGHAIVFQLQPAGMHLVPDAAVYVLLGARADKRRDQAVPEMGPGRQKDGNQEH